MVRSINVEEITKNIKEMCIEANHYLSQMCIRDSVYTGSRDTRFRRPAGLREEPLLLISCS